MTRTAIARVLKNLKIYCRLNQTQLVCAHKNEGLWRLMLGKEEKLDRGLGFYERASFSAQTPTDLKVIFKVEYSYSPFFPFFTESNRVTAA